MVSPNKSAIASIRFSAASSATSPLNASRASCRNPPGLRAFRDRVKRDAVIARRCHDVLRAPVPVVELAAPRLERRTAAACDRVVAGQFGAQPVDAARFQALKKRADGQLWRAEGGRQVVRPRKRVPK